MNLTRAPQSVANFVGWLDTNGYKLLADATADTYNQNLVFISDTMVVHLNETKGDWSVMLSQSSSAPAFSARFWRDWFHESPHTTTTSLDEDLHFIVTEGTDAMARARRHPDTTNRAVQARALQWSKSRFG